MDKEEFINSLKRDKARGNLAPHQIILLIALYNIVAKNSTETLEINELNDEFQKVWYEHKGDFVSVNNKVGLPLKAFVNRGYLTLEITDTIIEFRNLKELQMKISTIQIDPLLIQIFKNKSIKKYLVSKISK